MTSLMSLRFLSIFLMILTVPCAFSQTESTRVRRSARSAAVATTTVNAAAAHPDNGVATASSTSSSAIPVTTGTRSARVQPVNEVEQVESRLTSSTVTTDGDLRIGYGLSAPAGYYDFDGSTLAWRKPAATDTHYLAVTVQDAGNKWLLGACKVSATLTDSKGKDTSITLTETWDPAFRHYGSNIAAPSGASTGSLSIKVEPPAMRRRDKVLGAFFTNTTTAAFTGVDLTTATLQADKQSIEPEQPVWPSGRRPFVPPTPLGGVRR